MGFWSDNAYENTRRITFGDEGATFVPVCEKCGRFVKADQSVRFDVDGQPIEANATCSKCGRIQMLWEGYVEDVATP